MWRPQQAELVYRHTSSPFSPQMEASWWLVVSVSRLPSDSHRPSAGRVVNADDVPVHGASVSVSGIAYNVTRTARGEYWRLLLPGTYTLTASASG